jgi:eukaryotic-like serine/threonine-protein kinase
MAQYLADTGRSPEPAVAATLEAAAAAKAWSPDLPGAPTLSAWAHLLRAAFESDAGRDLNASLARAEQSEHDVERIAPASLTAYELRGMLASTRALHQLREGRDPEPALREARSAWQHVQDQAPWDADNHIRRARVEVLGLRWALRQRKIRKAQLDAAFAPLLPMLAEDRAQPHLYQTLAEIYEIRAAWRHESREAIGQDVTLGLQMSDKALAINPRMATALAVKGALFLMRARASRDPDAKRDAALRARALLSLALRENPLVERNWKHAIEEVERLLHAGETPSR